MRNEHYLNNVNLTPESVKSSIENSQSDELTYLVPKNDERAGVLLRENGFRYVGKRLVKGEVLEVFKWFRNLGKYEDMGSFFDRRVRDYDLHMSDGNSAHESNFISLFKDVPETGNGIDVLDLGCGTGAELQYIFQKAPNAHLVGIDISRGMLEQLRKSYRNFAANIETICGSYLETDFGENKYDFVVACSTLHHLLAEDKAALYVRIQKGLRSGGWLLISDYYADSLQEKQSLRQEYLALVDSGVISKEAPHHIDLTLTLEHELKLLKDAGFMVTRAQSWPRIHLKWEVANNVRLDRRKATFI